MIILIIGLMNFYAIFLDSINEEDNINDIMRDFEDNINEKIDGTTDIYTSNLTAWLNHNNSNVYYFFLLLNFLFFLSHS